MPDHTRYIGRAWNASVAIESFACECETHGHHQDAAVSIVVQDTEDENVTICTIIPPEQALMLARHLTRAAELAMQVVEAQANAQVVAPTPADADDALARWTEESGS